MNCSFSIKKNLYVLIIILKLIVIMAIVTYGKCIMANVFMYYGKYLVDRVGFG